MTFEEALKSQVSQKGESLSEMSHRSPVLVVFLRHFG